MCRVSAFRRDMRSEAAEGAASVQHGERRDETERRGGDMATRFIGGMIAEGLPLDNQVNRTTRYAADQNGGHRLLSTL